jgi:hypothetical protein
VSTLANIADASQAGRLQGSAMKTALEHPLVADYLRRLHGALGSLEPRVAAELSEQLRAHIVEALPPDASDDMVAEVLAALGPPAMVAAEAGLPWPRRNRPRQSLWRMAAYRARRLPLRAWLVIVPLALAVCLAAGTLIVWEVQPSLGFYSGSYAWWYSVDSAREVTTQAAGATQDTVPLRPGQLQGFAVLIYNPSDLTQRIMGAPESAISVGAPVPSQIAVATTTPPNLVGEPHAVRYEIGGAIPAHSYSWVRVLWHSYRCYLNAVGSSQGSNELTVRVQLGWITRTEDIQLPTEFAVSATKANVQAAYCQAHGYQPTP